MHYFVEKCVLKLTLEKILAFCAFFIFARPNVCPLNDPSLSGCGKDAPVDRNKPLAKHML